MKRYSTSSMIVRMTLGAIVAALALPRSTSGQYYMNEFTLKDLVKSSDIVVAEVISVKSHWWNEDKSRMYSEIELEVDSRIKGELERSSRFKILQMGGSIGGVRTFVVGSPNFLVSEQSVFFLSKVLSVEYGDHFTVFGSRYGKYDVTTDSKSGMKKVVRDQASEPLRMEQDGIILPLTATDGITLQEFIDHINAYLE